MRARTLAVFAVTFLVLALTAGLTAQAPVEAPAQPQPGAALTRQQRQQIRDLGYRTGYSQGHADALKGIPFDYLSHPDYSAGNQGYSPDSGLGLETYRFNYRAGFENGYDDGYYGRLDNPHAQPVRTYGSQPAANPSAPAAGARETGTVPAGTVLNLKLDNSLSTRSSVAGDRFSATVTQPVLGPNGGTLIPTGSIVLGHVGAASPASGLTGKSTLQLRFEQLRLPDGHTAALQASVAGVGTKSGGVGNTVGNVVQGTPSAGSEGGVQQSRTRKTVGDVAAGGAVGALLGAIIGGGKGAAIGTAAGAGLGVVLASKSGSLDLPAGTPITIRLSSPVYLR